MVKRDGDDAILKELTAGQWFGESEVKTSQASGANVIAKTPVQLFQLDRASYLATFGQVCVARWCRAVHVCTLVPGCACLHVVARLYGACGRGCL